jgi:hypothetical protein
VDPCAVLNLASLRMHTRICVRLVLYSPQHSHTGYTVCKDEFGTTCVLYFIGGGGGGCKACGQNGRVAWQLIVNRPLECALVLDLSDSGYSRITFT